MKTILTPFSGFGAEPHLIQLYKALGGGLASE